MTEFKSNSLLKNGGNSKNSLGNFKVFFKLLTKSKNISFLNSNLLINVSSKLFE